MAQIKDYWEARLIGSQFAVKPSSGSKLQFMWSDTPKDQRPNMNDLQEVLDWLAVQHPQTTEWPIHFLQGHGTCNRRIMT